MKKIAFLFLIYDSFENENLWYYFFNSIDINKYNIYIHYKNNIQLKYFNNYKLKNCIETKYADVSLVLAQNLLLREALKDTNNQNFIFLSNSCIPLKNFDYIYDNLNTNLSYFNLAKNEHIFENNKGKYLKENFNEVKKASQWSILNRKHAAYVSNINLEPKIKSIFKKDHAISDEYCYITLLWNKFSSELLTTYYECETAKTFEYWDDKSYFYNQNFTSTHPNFWERKLKTYYTIDMEELNYLLISPCLFGRKFSKEVNKFMNNDVYKSHICVKKPTINYNLIKQKKLISKIKKYKLNS